MGIVIKVGLTFSLVLVLIFLTLFYSNLSDFAKGLAQEKIPGLTFTQIEVGWNDVQLIEVRYTKNGKVRLSADLIYLQPSLTSLWSRTFRVSKIELISPHFYVEKSIAGEIKWPIFQHVDSRNSKTMEEIQEVERFLYVGEFLFKGGSGEFLDRSVGTPPGHFKIYNVDLTVKDFHYPFDEANKILLDLSLKIDGPRDTVVKVTGWADLECKSARIDSLINRFDLIQIEPYVRSPRTTVRPNGNLDVVARWEMNHGEFTFNGEMELDDLTFDGNGSVVGLPVGLVKQYLRLKNDVIKVPFEITGDINQKTDYRDQVLSVIRQALLTELGTGPLKTLIQKLVRGVGASADGSGSGIKIQIDKLRNFFQKRH